MPHRLLLALAAAVALTVGAIASAEEDRVYLDLTVNGVAHPATFAVLRDGDVLVPLADVRALGLPATEADAQTLFGVPYVSLHALSRMLTFAVDASALTLSITRNGTTFTPVAIDASAAPPPDAERVAARGIVADYGIHADDSSPVSGSVTARWNAGDRAVVETTEGRGSDGEIHRGMSTLTLDAPAKLRRAVIGDAVLSGGSDFGGAAVAGGISVRRAFDENPYETTFPLPSAQTTVLQPSTADVYVNGSLVKTIDLAPGTYDLQNLPLRTGIAHAEVVVRDAFGQRTILNQTTFASSGLLRKGLTDYAFGAGFARTNVAAPGDAYGTAVAAGSYRLGLTSGLTAGASVEAASGQSGASVSLDGVVPFGYAHAAFGASRAGAAGGTAVVAAFTSSGRRASFSAQYRSESPSFTALGLKTTDDRPSAQWTLGLNDLISRYASLSLSVQSARDRDAEPVRSATLQYGLSLGNGSIVAAVTRSLGNATLGASNAISVYYSRRLGTATTQSIAYAPGAGRAGTTVDLQRAATSPLSTQYRISADAGTGMPVSGSVHVGLPAVTIDANASDALRDGTFAGSLDLNGAIVATGGSVLFSQPIDDAYAVLRAPGVAGAPVYANNIVVGRTNRNGDAVIPALGSYQANRIGLSIATLPYDRVVDGADRAIVPSYHGGAIVRYGSRTIHDVTGFLRAADGPIVYGQLDLPNANGITVSSPTDGDGRFYFSGLAPGTYAGVATRADGATCNATVKVPSFTGVELQLGVLACTAK